jgi:predicted transcriptional regulator of viral defense system
MHDDPGLPLVFTTADARRLGLTQEQCEQRVRAGRWRRLGRGLYCLGETWEKAAPEGRHMLRALAVARSCEGGRLVALSHITAAVAHGLPVPLASLPTITLTRPPDAPRLEGRDRRVFRAALPEEDLVKIQGVQLTSAARTVADCLRHLSRGDAVAVADAALRARKTDERAVRRVLERQAGWPYAAVAALTLPLVDARRESPLESRSAVVMADHGLPAPTPQWEVFEAAGPFVARTDFGWPELGVVGEADGRTKYTGDAARVVEHEKDRQARLEALGLIVVRWDERHLHGPVPELVTRLLAAFQRGDPKRFRGRAA